MKCGMISRLGLERPADRANHWEFVSVVRPMTNSVPMANISTGVWFMLRLYRAGAPFVYGHATLPRSG